MIHVFSFKQGGSAPGWSWGWQGRNREPLKSQSLPKLGEKLPLGGREGWGAGRGWQLRVCPEGLGFGVWGLATLSSPFLLHHVLPL